jgi:hypothetical protein
VSAALSSETYAASVCATLGINGSTLGLPSGIIQTSMTATASVTSQIATTSPGQGTGPTATATKSDGGIDQPHFWRIVPIIGVLGGVVLF